jgi:hypothetical protein
MSSSRHFAPSVVVSQSDRFKSSCRFPTCSPARDLQCTFSCAKCWLSFKSVVARDWGAKTLEVTWFGKKIVLRIVFVSEGNRQEMRCDGCALVQRAHAGEYIWRRLCRWKEGTMRSTPFVTTRASGISDAIQAGTRASTRCLLRRGAERWGHWVDRKISQRLRCAYLSALLREPTLLSELLRSEPLVEKGSHSTGRYCCHDGMASLYEAEC